MINKDIIPEPFNIDSNDFSSIDQIIDMKWDQPTSPRYYRTLQSLKKYINKHPSENIIMEHKLIAIRILLCKRYERNIYCMDDIETCFTYQQQINKKAKQLRKGK
jgi:hypothetical protein